MRENTPVGTRRNRIRKAIFWHHTTAMTRKEIAAKLGVEPSTVDDYLASPEAKEADRVIREREAEIRRSVVEDVLRPGLQAAGHEAREGETDEQRDEAAEDVRELLVSMTTLAGARGRR